MRALRVVSGIAVLLVAIHFIHGIHHVVSHNGAHGAGLWAAVALAVVIDVFAIVGGVLLLRS
jgi:hypothetical protein